MKAAAAQGFRKIFERYYRSVYFFFANRGLSEDECLDLTQETFLRVYKMMGSLREQEKVSSWLIEIASNLWKNELRRRSADKRSAREVSLDEAMAGETTVGWNDLGASGCARPLEEVLAAEAVERVRSALRKFPPQMRRCFLLRFAQELKYREIAAIMHLSIETVKSQLGQARHRLRTEIAEVVAEGHEVRL